MEESRFNAIIEATVDRSLSVLAQKNAGYSEGSLDKLAGMKHVAEIKGVSTLEAISGMMAKHTSSIYTMLKSEGAYPLSVWQEKITDHINYLLFVEAAVFEERDQLEVAVDSNEETFLEEEEELVEESRAQSILQHPANSEFNDLFTRWFITQPSFGKFILASGRGDYTLSARIDAEARAEFYNKVREGAK